MVEIAPMVTKFLIIVLSLYVGPADFQQLHIDLVTETGFHGTMVVMPTTKGYRVSGDCDGAMLTVATIQRVPGNPSATLCTDLRGNRRTVDLAKSVANFKNLKPRQAKDADILLTDGGQVRLRRSGSVTYLTFVGKKETYVVHAPGKPKTADSTKAK